MKTVTKKSTYEKVMGMQRTKHRKPLRPLFLIQILIRLLSFYDLLPTKFTYDKHEMEKIGKKEPCLILMNHSSFIDLEIASHIFFPKRYGIVTTSDSFVGPIMRWLMPLLGCIPTQKFVSDVSLIRDIQYMLKEKKTSVLMYPEASYSFDGTATPLPRKMGILLKKYDVPVIMIETFGAFGRNPLYNELQIRRHVPITAKARVLYTREEIKAKSVRELSEGVEAAFGFDHFRWQKEQNLHIDQPFRADGLHRILYKCAHCGAEDKMLGKGTTITCGTCGKTWELTTLGQLKALEGETEISHIPDYYRWEREQIRQQILEGTYRLEADVEIAMQVDNKAIYKVGSGHLTHDNTGFHLTGCDGRLDYVQKPQAHYSLYADYYWYEIADVICVGDAQVHHFCFFNNGESVAKLRLAAEEMYKLYKEKLLK